MTGPPPLPHPLSEGLDLPLTIPLGSPKEKSQGWEAGIPGIVSSGLVVRVDS